MKMNPGYYAIAGLIIIMLVYHRAVKKYERDNHALMPEDITPEELHRQGYRHLQNVVKETTSLRDPRPSVVKGNLEKKGWEVRVCPEAKDFNGKIVNECNSLWGKWKLRVVVNNHQGGD